MDCKLYWTQSLLPQLLIRRLKNFGCFYSILISCFQTIKVIKFFINIWIIYDLLGLLEIILSSRIIFPSDGSTRGNKFIWRTLYLKKNIFYFLKIKSLNIFFFFNILYFSQILLYNSTLFYFHNKCCYCCTMDYIVLDRQKWDTIITISQSLRSFFFNLCPKICRIL